MSELLVNFHGRKVTMLAFRCLSNDAKRHGPRDECKRGHKLEGSNLRVYDNGDGTKLRKCWTCALQRSKQRYRKQTEGKDV